MEGRRSHYPPRYVGDIFVTEIYLIWTPGLDLDKDSMKTIYEKFGLEPGTQDFIGHAMALYLDDE